MDYDIIRKFYNNLEDEESRFIFRCRTQYLLTGSKHHLYDMVESLDKRNQTIMPVHDIYAFCESGKVDETALVLYGVGKKSSMYLDRCVERGLDVVAFCDSDDELREKKLGVHLGLPLISLDELLNSKQFEDCIVAISSTNYRFDIYKMLISKGIPNERLLVFSKAIPSEMYFDSEIIYFDENEVFLDAGCSNGNSIKRFTECCYGNYKKIIGFEPLPLHYDVTSARLKEVGIENTEIHQKAVWSTEEVCNFRVNEDIPSSSRITESGDLCVKAVTIDDIVGDDEVTFIKMDIEGAELEGLKGAKSTILRHKPKLAICIYHKPEDIIEIPEFIYSLGLDYKYYIRHHNTSDAELYWLDTVFYAV
jgi:FkbM family methyltransferase